MANITTKVITWFNGEIVGCDQFGNKYYRQRKVNGYMRRRRWVIYKDNDEASNVPPEFNAWLHYTVDEFPSIRQLKSWQKQHIANQTGTSNAYRPAGHAFEGGKRAKATGDYTPWTPE